MKTLETLPSIENTKKTRESHSERRNKRLQNSPTLSVMTATSVRTSEEGKEDKESSSFCVPPPPRLPWRSLINVLFCRKTVAALNKEVQNKTLLQLEETDRLRHTEHQLHASESKVERLNSENIKLRLKIDDLRIKLQGSKYRLRSFVCVSDGRKVRTTRVVQARDTWPTSRFRSCWSLSKCYRSHTTAKQSLLYPKNSQRDARIIERLNSRVAKRRKRGFSRANQTSQGHPTSHFVGIHQGTATQQLSIFGAISIVAGKFLSVPHSAAETRLMFRFPARSR